MMLFISKCFKEDKDKKSLLFSARCPSGRFGNDCQLSCRCQAGEPCNEVTGVCPGNCSDGWSGPNCQRQNVALGMPTEMKTTAWTKGSLAVDGDIKTCVTSSSNRTGWWRVDLLNSRLIYFIEIHLGETINT
ncbi:tyrosine-protein kinase receptor Tie-1 [Elysia marginata]|uniref:Tyrosine-protein kinase receptor Tie-1 n=1 Tax=Elysia marginata TaxID=1093978 RepID=A0AAV4EKU0_9GAST|nr:tyrosine-protein kinase receptor Tie-1 [Elysia marginata]